MVFQSEWTIAFPFLLQLWQHWFRPMVDLFATPFNHRLDVNMSPVPDPAAWRVDTLSFSLSNLLSYASPPPFTSAEGVSEGRVGSGHDDPRRFQVARPTVGPRSPRPHAGPSSQTAHRAENSHSVTQRLSRRESTRSRSSRVTSAQGLLLAPGASQETLALVRDSHRPGTPSIYAALLTWCGKGFNSLRLLEEGHSASTIRGYRPAISALPP